MSLIKKCVNQKILDLRKMSYIKVKIQKILQLKVCCKAI